MISGMMNDANAERTLRKHKESEKSVNPVLIQEFEFPGREKIQEIVIWICRSSSKDSERRMEVDASQVVW
jgi:hypothetical protein